MMQMQQRMRNSLMNKISLAFKKLLGNGRAWMCVDQFTSEFIDVITDAVAEVAKKISDLKLVHFPTKTLNENDIKNDEELFGVSASGTLQERAANVETQWRLFAGGQNYKQIEQLLQKRGLPVNVVENINADFDLRDIDYIGNGELAQKDGKSDPVTINDGREMFYLCAERFLEDEEIDTLINTLLSCKPAQTAAYYYPPYLRKKEIHEVLTKSQMEQIYKKHYCNVKTGE